ncbi:MAG: DUF4339 domain-containing protein [Bdellovibrionales bacterium]|nr:DUF4339 domain-containing protein [Bdellovibrionales bacterium]
MSKYIVSQQGQEIGPYTEDEIRALLQSKQIQPIDYIYDEEIQDWVLIMDKFDFRQIIPGHRPNPMATKDNVDIYPQLPTKVIQIPKNQAPLLSMEPKTSTLSSEPTQSPSPPYNQVVFNSGVANLELRQVQAGAIQIRFEESTIPQISLPETHVIQIQAAQAHSIEWKVPPSVISGETVNVEFYACDHFGNSTTQFENNLDLVVHSQHAPQHHKIQFQSGEAKWSFTPTLTETIQLELHDTLQLGLHLPGPQLIQIKPGALARFVLESPPETIAGENLSLTIKAVDKFGNLVVDFKGEIGLKISLDQKPQQKVKPIGFPIKKV